ncbi:dienelactone hydrolase [Paraburkholderia sp. GAS333]
MRPTIRRTRKLPLLTGFMISAALIASVTGTALAANENAPIATDLHETVVKVPMTEHGLFGDHERDIVATTYMPDGPGPFPLIVLSHGSPPDPLNRPKVGRYRELPQIHTFVQLGFAVIVPIRRGFGATGGAYAEDGGSCKHPDYTTAGKQAAQDVLAALAYADTLPQVDRDHVVLVGQSAGGFASLAAASFAPKGLVAVVNFSGGRGGNPSKHPGMPCGPEEMAGTIGKFASTTHVPVLWHYVQNDMFFEPDVVATWFAAFQAAGGQGQLIVEPPFGRNGHGMFAVENSMPIWLPHFEQFLAPLVSMKTLKPS